MKHTLPLLLLAGLVALPASAGKKHKWTTFERPAVAYSYGESLLPREVSFCDTCTRITFDVEAPVSWNLSASARLVVGQQSFPVRRGYALQRRPPVEGQPVDTTTIRTPFAFDTNYFGIMGPYYMDGVDVVTPGVVLEFPPLPKGTKSVTFDEGVDNPQQFCVSGIRLDGTTYPELLREQQTTAAPLSWTASTSAAAQECRVRVKVVGDGLPAGYTIDPTVYPVGKGLLDMPLSAPEWTPDDANPCSGVFTMQFAAPTVVLIYLKNSREDVYAVPCIPGSEVVLTVDYPSLHAVASSSMGKDQRPDRVFSSLAYADGTPFKFNHDDDFAALATNADVARQRIADRQAAVDILDRLGKLEEVPMSEVDALVDAYRPAVAAKHAETLKLIAMMKEGRGGKICEVPDVAPAEMIKAIVSRYKGKAVYVDLWATWCGPCCNGIKAMKPHHDDFSADDVQFVYITDESSPADKWNTMVVDMPGDHYRLKTMQGLEPAISGIPRYLIFDREGNLSCDRAGFGPGTELELCEEIRKAMGK